MQGMIEIVMPAWSIPQSVPPRLVSVRAVARITGSVNADSLLFITSEPSSSFHDVMKANSATVTIAGTTAGRSTRRRTCQRAAAVDDRGLLELARHRLEAVAHDVQAERQLDRRVQDREAEERVRQLAAATNIRNIGVSSAWYGMIRASSRKTKRTSLPGIGKRASA